VRKDNAADKDAAGGRGNASQRFMRATGKLRAVFGPASRSSLVHEMTEENRKLLVQREAESQQWETVRRADGSTYIVPRNPDDKSLR
jgi:aspartate/methionine/tyrosine aminotransferase